MLVPQMNKWYMDLVDIYRLTNIQVGNITKSEETKINAAPVPCRIYQSSSSKLQTSSTAAKVTPTNKLACAVEIDIQPGDRLMVKRGGRINLYNKEFRYFAGDISEYYEPFGGVIPLLAHKQVALMDEMRAKKVGE